MELAGVSMHSHWAQLNVLFLTLFIMQMGSLGEDTRA